MFGKPDTPELKKLRQQLKEADERLQAETAQPTPTLALYRTRHLARLARLRKYRADLAAAIHHEENKEKTDKVSR